MYSTLCVSRTFSASHVTKSQKYPANQPRPADPMLARCEAFVDRSLCAMRMKGRGGRGLASALAVLFTCMSGLGCAATPPPPGGSLSPAREFPGKPSNADLVRWWQRENAEQEARLAEQARIAGAERARAEAERARSAESERRLLFEAEQRQMNARREQENEERQADSLRHAPQPERVQTDTSEEREDESAGGRACCRICRAGCACGDSCISCSKTCHRGPGCACDG